MTPLLDQTIPPAHQYFLGTIAPDANLLRTLIERLPCQAICVCSPHESILQELQAMDFPGKQVTVQLLNSSYPIREYFLKSRRIAIRRIDEHEQAFPNTYALKCNPRISFKRLATRRLSITRIYYEFTILNEFMKLIPEDGETRGLFVSYAISDEDVRDCFAENRATRQVSTLPVPIHFPVTSDKNRMKAYRNEQFKDWSNLFKRPSKFLKYHINAQKIHLKPWLFKARFQYRAGLRALMNQLMPKQSHEVLVFIYSIDPYKIHYYSVLYKPLLEKLLAEGKRIKVIIYHESTEVFEAFQDRFRQSDGSMHPRLLFEHYTNESLGAFIEYSNLQLFHSMDPAAWNALPSPQRERIGHTQSAFGSLQSLISVMHHVLLNNRFSILLGKEEDSDCMTMLKILAGHYGRAFESVVIPSCLPEYSELYDMIDIDHFCTHHEFVKKLFTDQHLNARHIHVVGSTEWEEPAPSNQTLPPDVQQLIDASDFVLGVFHQPLFTQYHQQEIYDHLVVDFPRLFQKFLDEHPRACILIKLHRSDKLADVQAYLPPSDRIKILDYTTSNQLLYKTFDVALAIHSTTLMHSIAHGLPAVCLYKYPDYGHYYDFIESMGCLATNSPDEVLAWIRLLKHDAGFRQQVLQKVEAYHRHIQQNPASEQILAIINQAYGNPSAPAGTPQLSETTSAS